MLNRRKLLERDPPVDFVAVLSEIRRLTGMGSSEIAFVLNVSRGTLHAWEVRGSSPNHEDGEAIRKLLAAVRACPSAIIGARIVAIAAHSSVH